MLAAAVYQRTSPRGFGRSTRDKIAFLTAQSDLLSECVAEVLANRFANFEVIYSSTEYALEPEALSDVSLILIYGVDPGAILDLSARLRKLDNGVSLAVVAAPSGVLDQNLGTLAKRRIIDGILPANLRLDVFVAAVELLMKGGEHFPSALLREISIAKNARITAISARRFRGGSGPGGYDETLTTREVEILDLLCSGTQNKIIADRLNLSENTVKVHIRNIYRKMKVKNRTEAVSRYFQANPDSRPAKPPQA